MGNGPAVAGYVNPLFPGCAEQPAGAAGAGLALRQASPGVASITAVADQNGVAAVAAVPAGTVHYLSCFDGHTCDHSNRIAIVRV